MASNHLRILRDVFLGACLGGIGAAMVWHLFPGFWKAPAGAAHEMALQRRISLQEVAQQQVPRAIPAAMQPVAAPQLCDWPALIAPSSARDGGELAEHPFPGGPRARAKVFLRRAEAATAQGRLRDAEVALLASCRENAAASKNPSLPLARVLGMLGDRYVAAARTEEAWAMRDQLMMRAEDVVRLSARAYASALGPNAPRSKAARDRLAHLMEELAAADPWQERVEPLATVEALPTPTASLIQPAQVRAPDTGTASRVPIRRDRAKPRPQQQAARAVAREAPDPQPVQPLASGIADAELQQLDADLARLREQARAVSDDPAGFGQRTATARADRDRCEDAGCLRDWYAQRRRQLLAEF